MQANNVVVNNLSVDRYIELLEKEKGYDSAKNKDMTANSKMLEKLLMRLIETKQIEINGNQQHIDLHYLYDYLSQENDYNIELYYSNHNNETRISFQDFN